MNKAAFVELRLNEYGFEFVSDGKLKLAHIPDIDRPKFTDSIIATLRSLGWTITFEQSVAKQLNSLLAEHGIISAYH